MNVHPVLGEVTARIVARSRPTRAQYLARMARAAAEPPARRDASCANLAHAFAACGEADKERGLAGKAPNIAIVTAYNDMLSSHRPYEAYPELIRAAARRRGATAQVAGGVPAMCDGVTQGRAGMELSLFSREVIAMSTAIALSHQVFDGALLLGVCDKIVPGLLLGALSFGHLPVVFVPSGPMTPGLPNEEKARVRRDYATGNATRDELLAAESQAYHGPGTCTFYGTANSNQMLLEIMGLQLPGSSFVNPGSGLRDALTTAAVERAIDLAGLAPPAGTLASILDERAIANGIVGLHATGGSTNHLLHLVAIARAAGIQVTLDDFAALSHAVPLLARVYPNGSADVNRLHAVGGMAFLVHELLDAGLLHADVATVTGQGLAAYATQPLLDGDTLRWVDGARQSLDTTVLRPVATPFADRGGLEVLRGSLGTAVMKVSAVAAEHWRVEAPAIVFDDPDELSAAFRRGELERDFVAVVRFQGPRANGMPELHQLTPVLSVLQKRGHHVALVTDGRMSGASGKVPAAIHVTPEASEGGPLARLRTGDVVCVDAAAGRLDVRVEPAVLAARRPAIAPTGGGEGCGRELFGLLRHNVSGADQGATIFGAES